MNSIKEARIAAGLTQQKMSDILDIPLSTIKQWDSEKRHPAPWVERLVVEKLNAIKKAPTTT